MLKGIDVSHHNGKINYSKLSCTDNQFVIAKATEGEKFVDPMFARNMANCRQYNFLHGAYHYVRGDVDPVMQAQRFVSVLRHEADPCTLLALDVEDATLTRLPSRMVGEIVYTMVAEIYASLVTYPLIYTSEKFMRTDTFKELSGLCGGWLAKWGAAKPKRSDLNTTIWQYSSAGRVDGIQGNVDMDKAYLTPENWLRIANPEGKRGDMCV